MTKVVDIFGMLSVDEGLKTIIYKDTLGYWTIGIGHLLSKNSQSEGIANLDKILGRSTKGVITTSEAQKLFQLDVDKALKSIKSNSILLPIYNSLDENRQFALVDMVFQMGAEGVASFKNSLTLVKNGNYASASSNLRKSKWYSQTPKRAERVIEVLTSGTLNAYN